MLLIRPWSKLFHFLLRAIYINMACRNWKYSVYCLNDKWHGAWVRKVVNARNKQKSLVHIGELPRGRAWEHSKVVTGALGLPGEA